MEKYLNVLPSFVDRIRNIREIIISNIVLIGQIPAPTFYERRRAACLVERLADFQVDECSIDDFGNPIGVIRGASKEKQCIFIVAHLDRRRGWVLVTLVVLVSVPFTGWSRTQPVSSAAVSAFTAASPLVGPTRPDDLRSS